MMRFDLQVHQRFQLMLVHIAADDQPQVVLDEFSDVLVFEDQRSLGEDLTLGGIFDHALKTHHAFLASHRQQVVHHGEQRLVVNLLVRRALEQAGHASQRAFRDTERVGDDEGADGGPADDHDFGGLPQRQQLTAVCCESTQHTAHHQDDTDDQIHARVSWRFIEVRNHPSRT